MSSEVATAIDWARRFGHTETGWAARVLATEVVRLRRVVTALQDALTEEVSESVQNELKVRTPWIEDVFI